MSQTAKQTVDSDHQDLPLAIEGLGVTDARLWVLDIDGDVSGIRAFDLDGAPQPPVELPPICAIDEVVRLGDDVVGYSVETFVSPPAWWVARDGEQAPRRTALDTSTSLDFSGIVLGLKRGDPGLWRGVARRLAGGSG